MRPATARSPAASWCATRCCRRGAGAMCSATCAAALAERLGAPLAAARGADVTLGDGDAFGPFSVLAVPGHADDHLVFVVRRAAFTGDAVLGEGSVFVSGRLREYLEGLRRLRAL